ncbi:hypothetical protein [Aerococcus loyolae]|uniref:hypothetical protein n=1 Tax=Aerococcus loyolae TaxID=2976809 RepID=UPI000DCC6927|nr:hypothetical protein DBT45_09825 [Aerococcus tenax]
MSKKLTMTMVASIMLLTTAAFAGAGSSFTLRVGAKGGEAPLNMISSTVSSTAAAACTNDRSPVALHTGGQDGRYAQQSRSMTLCKASLGGAAQNRNYSKN